MGGILSGWVCSRRREGLEGHRVLCRFGGAGPRTDPIAEALLVASTIISSTAVVCVSPAVDVASTVLVRASLEGIVEGETGRKFAYYADPRLERVEPSAVGAGAQQVVTVIGSGMLGAAVWCRFGGASEHAGRARIRCYLRHFRPVPSETGQNARVLGLFPGSLVGAVIPS